MNTFKEVPFKIQVMEIVIRERREREREESKEKKVTG